MNTPDSQRPQGIEVNPGHGQGLENANILKPGEKIVTPQLMSERLAALVNQLNNPELQIAEKPDLSTFKELTSPQEIPRKIEEAVNYIAQELVYDASYIETTIVYMLEMYIEAIADARQAGNEQMVTDLKGEIAQLLTESRQKIPLIIERSRIFVQIIGAIAQTLQFDLSKDPPESPLALTVKTQAHLKSCLNLVKRIAAASTPESIAAIQAKIQQALEN